MNAVVHEKTKGDLESRLTDETRLECRICWNVYDPAMGDDIGQIQAGTPFSSLPQDWCCPECESPGEMYLPIDDT
ncbi:MAG: rubredoxin [Gammaproteobacteria bacterium]